MCAALEVIETKPVPGYLKDENHATEEGRAFSQEEITTANANDALLRAENEVNRANKNLSSAEGNLHEKGLALGRAVIALREEYKRRGNGYLDRLPALGVSRAKAYYWINEVEGKPNNRHRRYEDEREFCVTQNSPASDANPGVSEPEPESEPGPDSE
jgi:hypothetical protein